MRKGYKTMLKAHVNRRIKILVFFSIFIMVTSGMPIKNVEASIFKGSLNMSDSPSKYRSDTFDEVYHRTFSYYFNSDTHYWVTVGNVHKRNYGWYGGGLISATTVMYSYNVNQAYPDNTLLLSNPRLYHYAPVHNTGDYWNAAGWISPFAYSSFNYNLPTSTTNHVYRTSGTRVINLVYTSNGRISFGDAKEWSDVVTANAVKYNTGSSGPEVRLFIYSYSWDREWHWWSGWQNDYHYERSAFYIDY